MTTDFKIKITIDGQDAAQQAGDVRKAIEKELGAITFQTKMDKSTANALKRMFSYAGKEAKNLERAAAALQQIGEVDPDSLEGLHRAMLSIKQDAKGIGKAMADGMQENWGRLETTLTAIQSQISGIVARGPASAFGEMTGEIQGLDDALDAGTTKAVSAMQKIKELEGRIQGATEEIGRLGSQRFQPLSGATTTTMDALFEGFASSGYKSYISRIKNKITRELEEMQVEVAGKMANVQDHIARRVEIGTRMRDMVIGGGLSEDEVEEVQSHYDRLGVAITVSAEGLAQNMEEVRQAIREHMAIEPPEGSPELAQWKEQMETLSAIKIDIDREIGEARSSVYDQETVALMSKMDARERELREEHAGNIELWEEFGMESIEEVKQALEREGQQAAANTIASMVKLQERVNRLQQKQKAQVSKLQKGATAQLPKGAQGTLVDFINAQKAMGDAVTGTIEIINEQADAFDNLVEAMDAAAKASEGMNYIERRASQELEAAARRELTKRTRASVPLDQAAENSRDVLTRLAGHVASLRTAIETPMDEMAQATDEAADGVESDVSQLRQKLTELQTQAMKEIESLPRRGVGIEKATEQSRAVLLRLAQEIEALQQTAAKPAEDAAEATQDTAKQVASSVDKIERELASDPTEPAKEQAKGLVKVWQWVSDKLVGHSIVPEMVAGINAELRKIDTRPIADVKSAATPGPTASDLQGVALYNETGQNRAVGKAMQRQHSTAWWAAYTNAFTASQEGMAAVAQKTEQDIAAATDHQQAIRNTQTAARAILDEWRQVYEELVGHSIIPDMVREINAWLAKVDPEYFGSEALVGMAESTAQEVSEVLTAATEGLPIENITARLADLEAERKSLNREMAEMTLRGGLQPSKQAGPRYRAMMDEMYSDMDKMRGEIGGEGWGSDEEAAMRAMGYMPKGWSPHQGERMTEGSEDEFVRALNTDAEFKTRFTAEEEARLEGVMEKLAAVEVQYATLAQSLIKRRDALLAQFEAITEDEGASPEEFERVYTQLQETEQALEQLDQQMREGDVAAKIQEAQDLSDVSTELEQDREQARTLEEQRAFNRSPEATRQKEIERRKTEAKKSSIRLQEQEEKLIRKAQQLTAELGENWESIQANMESSGQSAAELVGSLTRQKQEQKQLRKAQQLAAELGEDWESIQSNMEASGQSAAEIVGSLTRQKKEARELAQAEARAQKEARQREVLSERAQQMTTKIGVSWRAVEDAADATGLSIEEIVRELETVANNQQRINRHADRLRENYTGIGGTIKLFRDEINAAAKESEGLTQLGRNLEQVANNLGRTSMVIGGSLIKAGKDYRDFISQTDMAARAVGLNQQMTQGLRADVMAMSTETGIDPREISRGLTAWAQDANVTIETQEELNALLENTIPIQEAVALTGVDMATMSQAAAAAINQYGKEMEDVEEITAIFNKVANETLASVSDVAGSFKMASATAERAGESLEDTAAVFTLLGENGIKATQAGTGYQQMLDNLLVPTSEKAKEVLVDLFGDEEAFFDQEGNFVGTAKAIEMIAEATRGLTDQQREAAMGALFTQNASRVAAILVREQMEAGAQGINTLKEKASELSADSLQEWEQQREDLESSETQRIARLEQEWRRLWLTIGQQGMELVLPTVEATSQALEKVSAFAGQYPQVVKAFAVLAGGGFAISRLLAATGTALQTINMASNLAKGTWGVLEFKSAVVTSAETFREIVTEAAATAATTETEGAKAEGVIEAESAVDEKVIEASSAEAEGVIEAKSAVDEEVIEAKGAEIEGALEAKSAIDEEVIEVTGAKTETAIETASAGGLAAALGTAAAGISALATAVLVPLAGIFGGAKIYDEFIADKIGGASLEQFGAVTAYAVGEALEKIGLGEDLGERWFSRRAGLEQEQPNPASYLPGPNLRTTGPSGDDMLREFGIMLPGTGIDGIKDLDGAIKDLGDTATDASYEIYDAQRQQEDAYDLSEEQEKAVDLYVELLQKQKTALDDLNASIAEANADLQTDLAKMEDDYNQNRRDAAEDFRQSEAEQERQHQEKRARALEEHNKRMRRMREDHEARVFDLELARDAAGLFKEKRNYEKEKSRAEEDFADQQQQQAEQYQRERAKRAQQHQQRMVDIETEYQRRRTERIQQNTERVAEMRQQHQEEMARLEREYFDKINAELNYFTQSKAQREAYYQAMIQDTERFLAANRNIWARHIANLPTPSGVSIPAGGLRARAAGGYIRNTEPHMMHAGEFVMSPGTTRQVEAAMGTRLNQQNVRRGGGVNISATFTGMGTADRTWYEAKLQEFEREITDAIL
ncbi:MAG: phage tail tape measure protein [Chloroflexi bacterium]|jgi:TP901 family phage tail tape measure protein|nr:phage tail tape measure protein [Chloroflexota bacterium]